MHQTRRKTLQQAYRDRTDCAGIFTVTCAAQGLVWIGHSPDVDKAQNRHWFTLRLGTHQNRVLQQAWNAHGEASFAFVIVERLKDQDLPGQAQRLAESRLAHWQAALNASTL